MRAPTCYKGAAPGSKTDPPLLFPPPLSPSFHLPHINSSRAAASPPLAALSKLLPAPRGDSLSSSNRPQLLSKGRPPPAPAPWRGFPLSPTPGESPPVPCPTHPYSAQPSFRLAADAAIGNHVERKGRRMSGAEQSGGPPAASFGTRLATGLDSDSRSLAREGSHAGLEASAKEPAPGQCCCCLLSRRLRKASPRRCCKRWPSGAEVVKCHPDAVPAE